MLTRDMILNIKDIEIEEVAVPEWGGSVFVKGLTGKERDEYQVSIMQKSGKNYEVNFKNATVKLVVACVTDKDGKQLFEVADIDMLSSKSGKALNRLYEVATKLSGLSPDDVDELVKNSGAIQNDSSISL